MKKQEYEALEQANELWLRAEVPPAKEIPEHDFSPEFQQKMEALFQTEKKSARRRKHMDRTKRIAAAVLAVLGLALGGVSTARALHLPVIQTIVSMVQEFTEYQFTSSASAPDTPPGGVTLTYLPEGMEEVSRRESFGQSVQEWRGNEGEFLILEQQLVTQDAVSVYGADERGAGITRFPLHGTQAVGREKGGNTSIFWTKDDFFYLLSSSLSMEELRQVAEGILF